MVRKRAGWNEKVGKEKKERKRKKAVKHVPMRTSHQGIQ
jgi:hypothetical protein